MDAQTSAPSATEQSKTLSVSAALALAKGALEGVTVHVVGEVCELNDKPGYKAVYFSIKDEHAVLPCMMWLSRYTANGLRFKLGDMLELTGRFTLYAAKGRMSFDVFSFTPVGEGNLRLRVAQLARKLEAEGLMAPEKKRKPAPFPQTIGLVPSPRGDAVHDVFRTLKRRYPLARVLFAGVPVEGTKAPLYIQEGIRCVVAAGAEVVLVVRGGGSYEDLMPYNDEGLARAIAACPVPVVTGIGHEPDTTIADMVADVRASTPTAAAETVSPDAEELKAYFRTTESRLTGAMSRKLERLSHEVSLRASRPLFSHPELLYASEAMHLDDAHEHLERFGAQMAKQYAQVIDLKRDYVLRVGNALLAPYTKQTERLHDAAVRTGAAVSTPYKQQISVSSARLQALSPLNVLARGYGIGYSPEGEALSSVATLTQGEEITVALSDGQFLAEVVNVTQKPSPNM